MRLVITAHGFCNYSEVLITCRRKIAASLSLSLFFLSPQFFLAIGINKYGESLDHLIR